MTGTAAGQPTGKLDPQPWMQSTALRAVLAALTAQGDEVRLVGGCVRDSLAHRPVRDIDLATPATPERIIALLEDAGLKAVPTGIKFGTITAVADGQPFEVTTLRLDLQTDGRRAVVAFTDDWVTDAARRDFTFNAMSCTPAGDVYDPFGGIEDLAQGRVRFVGRAEDRIQEDYLRLLRFFRFHAHYGRPPADGPALAACRALAPRLTGLSGERVRHEMLRLLEADQAAEVILLMAGERILDPLLPEAGDITILRPLIWLETTAVKAGGVTPDPLRRLAALLRSAGAEAVDVATRWRLSNRDRDRLIAACAAAPVLTPDGDGNGLRGLLYRQGGETVRDRLLLDWAARRAVAARMMAAETTAWIAALDVVQSWTPVRFSLSGRDVLNRGVAKGPAVGVHLKAVEAWWVAGGCRADRAACLAALADRF